MYLFVYIFLLVSIMGLYTQLYSLQVARMNNSFKGVAEAMYVWHRSAVDLAKDTRTLFTHDVSGVETKGILPSPLHNPPNLPNRCSLSPALAPAITQTTTCQNSLNLSPAVLTDPALWIQPGYARIYLPLGYNFTVAQFNTLLYNASGAANGRLYLVTYVDPTTPVMGYTANEIYKQIQKAGFPQELYGVVSNGGFRTNLNLSGGNTLFYTTMVPGLATSILPDGTVGFVTAID